MFYLQGIVDHNMQEKDSKKRLITENKNKREYLYSRFGLYEVV